MGVCIRYRCERNSSAEITKEIDPKECEHDQGALMDSGDKIVGEEIDVWVKGVKPQKIGLVGGFSGRHKTQTFQTSTDTYASLLQSFAPIENAEVSKKNN